MDTAPSFHLRPLTDGSSTTTLRATGDLELTSAHLLEDGLREVAESGARSIVVDLRAIGFCDASGVNALVALQRHAVRHGARLALRPSPQVRRVLAMSGVADVFTLLD